MHVQVVLAAIAVGLATAQAQSLMFTPQNWTDSEPEPSSDQTIEVAYANGTHMTALAGIISLTPNAHASAAPGIMGPLVVANANNRQNISHSDIALISCDSSAYPGFIKLQDVLQNAESVRTAAIIMYTSEFDYCHLTSAPGNYTPMYTSISQAGTTAMLSQIQDSKSSAYVSIGIPDKATNGTNGPGTSNSGPDSSLGPSPSTAVAMIILYSVTGIITALFLGVIITGAVRVHRNPQRYGPQNIFGRPRQSRARGIARAMLDSLPIVKFGERQEDVNKPVDVELNERDATNPAQENPAQVQKDEQPTGDKEITALANPAENPATTSVAPAVDGAATTAIAAESAPQPIETDNAAGCSICTEDFVIGEDQRVLPCDHRFHPACVDPWLLNVSGTCPLCRIDLNPPEPEPPVLDAREARRQARQEREADLATFETTGEWAERAQHRNNFPDSAAVLSSSSRGRRSRHRQTIDSPFHDRLGRPIVPNWHSPRMQTFLLYQAWQDEQRDWTDEQRAWSRNLVLPGARRGDVASEIAAVVEADERDRQAQNPGANDGDEEPRLRERIRLLFSRRRRTLPAPLTASPLPPAAEGSQAIRFPPPARTPLPIERAHAFVQNPPADEDRDEDASVRAIPPPDDDVAHPPHVVHPPQPEPAAAVVPNRTFLESSSTLGLQSRPQTARGERGVGEHNGSEPARTAQTTQTAVESQETPAPPAPHDSRELQTIQSAQNTSANDNQEAEAIEKSVT